MRLIIMAANSKQINFNKAVVPFGDSLGDFSSPQILLYNTQVFTKPTSLTALLLQAASRDRHFNCYP